jgi:membrane-bound metal-dependent hydrolase YbcI (DUF457 family)
LDNLTHTLVGATLARTPLGRAGRGVTAALLLSSNAPDVDIVTAAGGSLRYLQWHRGPTHGPLGVVGLGFATAAIVWIGRRIADSRRTAAASGDATTSSGGADHDASFAMLTAAAIIGVAVHILMDLPTSYGTRLLSPFSWRWYALDWMPIVDIYLLIVLVASLFGRAAVTQRHRRAAIVLAIIAANYGLRAAAHKSAIELAPRLFGPTLPPRCTDDVIRSVGFEAWPSARPVDPPPGGRRCLVTLAAMPSFTSPFRWRIVAQMSNAYEVHDIDVLDNRFGRDDSDEAPWRTAVRYPNVWTPVVNRAATTHLGEIFLGFSRFPAARSAVDAHGGAVVRWSDIRFTGGIAGLEQPTRSVTPFTAIVRFDADGRVVEERIVR